jgi:Zn-dependent peptidase ImmA (M78 family)/DNA-binding XRE family transcriptional regulator
MTADLVQFPSRPVGFIPNRLTEAREARHLNMTQLAELVEVTPSAISQFEAGIKQPDPLTLGRIAHELDQPISYFINSRPDGGDERCTVFYRSFSGKTKSDHKMFDVWRLWAAQVAHYANAFVDFPLVSLPDFAFQDAYTEEEIENRARECRRFWGLGDGPIANLVALLESKGAIVIQAMFGLEKVDAFSCWQDGRPFIFLGQDKGSAARSRFDAAHELGHILLHRHVSRDAIQDPSILQRIEREANRFASALLLPAKTFVTEVFAASIKHFIALKRRWRVSIAAMIYRCQDLGIFDEAQILRLRKQMSYHGYVKSEPLDDELVQESNSLLQKAFRLLVENKIKAATEILSEIKLSANALMVIAATDEALLTPTELKPAFVAVNLRIV